MAKIKSFWTWLIVWTVVFILLGYFVHYYVVQDTNKNIRQDISRVMDITLAAVNPDRIERQAKTPKDETNPDFIRLREQFLKLGPAFAIYGVDSVYAMSQEGEKILFLVDTLPEDDPDYGPAGEEYLKPPKELLQVFSTGVEKETGLYTDEYGTYLSVFSPIRKFSDNKMVGVMGVDIDDKAIQQRVIQSLIIPMVLVFLVYLIFIGLSFYFYNRRQFLRELSSKSNQFRAIFDNIRAGILVADPETKKFVLSNHQMSELTGYTQEELLKMGVEDLHPKKDLPFVLESFEKQAKGLIKTVEVPVLRKDQTIVYCEVRTATYRLNNNNNNNKELLLGVFNDVTTERLVKQEIKNRVEEVERMNKLMVDRELKMVELKKENEALRQASNKK